MFLEALKPDILPDFRLRKWAYPSPSTRTSGCSGIAGGNATRACPRATTTGGAFFIVIGDQPSLDFGGTRNEDGLGFAAFGHVKSGMDVVHAIHQMESTAPTDITYLRGQLLNEPVTIRKAYRQP